MIKRRGLSGGANAPVYDDEAIGRRQQPRITTVLRGACLCAFLVGAYWTFIIVRNGYLMRNRERLKPPQIFQTTVLADLPTDMSGWRTWAALEREAAFSPTAAAPPSLPPPGGRYLLPLLITEGFGAWSDAILETIAIAAQLNRTWVEPCVRNGCIEPCRCGRVRPVATWSTGAAAAAAAAGVDPGRLPRIDEPCRFDSSPRKRPIGFAADTYPLSAYIDVAALLAPSAGVSYAAWCAAYERDYAPARDSSGLWPASRVYSYDLMRDARDRGPSFVGDFAFAETVKAGGRGRELALDDAPHVFLTELVRGYFAPVDSLPQLPLARWHAAAVNDFTAGSDGFAAFHWRSEGVDSSRFANCSSELARAIAAVLPLAESPAATPPRALLVADMPAPGNTAKMWDDYPEEPELLARQWAAVGTLLAVGLVKYDAALRVAPGVTSSVDAGVLSLRDFLFSTRASLYVTCQGSDCRGCFRDESNIVRRILQVRRQAGRPSVENWFELAREHLPVSLATRAES